MKDATKSPAKPSPDSRKPATAPAVHPTLTAAQGRASRRADALFKAMSSDFLLREQFVTDPAQVMSDYINEEHLDAGAADAANQLLYAVMSNPRMRDWMGWYSRKLRGGTPTRHGFARDFARAIATRGDEATALSLIRAASQGHDAFVLPVDVLRSIITLIGGRMGSGGTEMSPGTGGTEVSPGTGTEMSPGAVFSGTEMSPGTGTEMSPGAIFSGTEMSPGTGTEMSPGAIFSGTEMSPGTGGTEASPGGTEMSPGAIFSGTEMSPGTGGTEVSPGTGTEMSPGGAVGRLPGYLQVSLGALVQYSNLLRARGALFVTGLEGR